MAWSVLKLQVEINSLGDQSVEGKYCMTYITLAENGFDCTRLTVTKYMGEYFSEH